MELKLGRVLDGHDAVLDRDEAGQDVEEGRLTGARPTRDDDVRLAQDGGLQKAESCLVAGAEPDQVFHLIGIAGELADREQRPVQSEGPDHGIDAGTVGQTRVTER